MRIPTCAIKASGQWPLLGGFSSRCLAICLHNLRIDYQLTVTDSELSEVERNARSAANVDDIDLEL